MAIEWMFQLEKDNEHDGRDLTERLGCRLCSTPALADCLPTPASL